MIRRKLNRRELPDGRSAGELADQVDQLRHVPLVCAGCRKVVSKDNAIKSGRQLRCPHCGGTLNREEGSNGQAKAE